MFRPIRLDHTNCLQVTIKTQSITKTLVLFVGYRTEVMIKTDSWDHLYFVVRGEILGFTKDKLVRQHSGRMFSWIKNESWGIEVDQIPS
jgi:hypothetical protein